MLPNLEVTVVAFGDSIDTETLFHAPGSVAFLHYVLNGNPIAVRVRRARG